MLHSGRLRKEMMESSILAICEIKSNSLQTSNGVPRLQSEMNSPNNRLNDFPVTFHRPQYDLAT